MNQHPQLVPLEVHPVTAEPETEQMPPVAVEAAEAVHLVAANIVGQTAKVPENLQLQLLGQRAQLRRGGGGEDNLEGRHGREDRGKKWQRVRESNSSFRLERAAT